MCVNSGQPPFMTFVVTGVDRVPFLRTVRVHSTQAQCQGALGLNSCPCLGRPVNLGGPCPGSEPQPAIQSASQASCGNRTVSAWHGSGPIPVSDLIFDQ